nr:hypothetical protein [Tanacetum cinerariifolium]
MPTQTILDASPGYIRLHTHYFSLANLRLPLNDFFYEKLFYTEDDTDLTFLPKYFSLGFNTSSHSVSINMKPVRADEEPTVKPTTEPAIEPVNENCKTRIGSLRPLIKKKLASGSSTSRTVRAKAFAIKDDTPVLSTSDNDEGLEDCLELKILLLSISRSLP